MENDLSGIQMKILEKLRHNSSYLRQLAKDIGKMYNYTCFELSKLKKRGFVSEEKDEHDKRKKILSLTNEGKLFLAKLEARKFAVASSVAKIDSWIDKKFNEIGIDCERLFK